MATMDVFNSTAFSTTSLSGTVDKMDYQPSLLGSLGIFTPEPVRTLNVFVERRDGILTLIQSQPDGAPPDVLENDTRNAVSFRIRQLAKRFTLMAREIQDIRAFGGETELMQVQREFGRRLQRIRNDMELTHENQRLGALQGKVIDADGSTVLYDFFEEFGEAEPAAIDFALDTATTDVRGKCAQVVRAMARAGKGTFTPATQVHALAGDEFFDALINHERVRETYLNYSAAADLRDQKAFGSFSFGGITWHNYRGTDDGAVGVPAAEAKFFPVGARDMFSHVMAPMGTVEYANTPGQSVYAMTVPDQQRNMWIKGEIYSYPLFLCRQPEVLQKATA